MSGLFGIELGRWIYGFNGVWLAQVFSFTPTAFLVLIGVVQGISPTMEEASQTLRASPGRTFATITLPLMLPGLANAWLFVVAAELIASSRGLGFLLLDSQNTGRTDVMLVAIILLAGLGKLSDSILGAVENRMLRRRR